MAWLPGAVLAYPIAESTCDLCLGLLNRHRYVDTASVMLGLNDGEKHLVLYLVSKSMRTLYWREHQDAIVGHAACTLDYRMWKNSQRVEYARPHHFRCPLYATTVHYW